MWGFLNSLRIIVPAAGAGTVIDASENRVSDSRTLAAARATRLHLLAKLDDAQAWGRDTRYTELHRVV